MSKAHQHSIESPSLRWVDGHILGNGDVGAVVYGSPERLSFSLSKHNVWELSRPAETPHGNRWEMSYPQMRDRILRGERDFLQTLGNKPYAQCNQCYQLACGTLDLELMRGHPWTGFRQTLSFLTAQCDVEVTPSEIGHYWGAEYKGVRVSSYIHADRNVLVIHLQSEATFRIAWTYTRPPSTTLSAPEYSTEVSDARNYGFMSHTLNTTHDKYAAAVSSDAKHFTCHASPAGVGGEIEFGGIHGPATLYVALSCLRDDVTDTILDAKKLVTESAFQTAEHLLDRHRAWWQDFWAKSSVEYSDLEINRLWYMGIYALGCSARPGKSAPHLQGIWNGFDLPPWHTDYHMNLNVQECHWAAPTSNHVECLAPIVRMLTQDWREELRRFAHEQFEAPGLAMGLCNDWLGRSVGGWCFDVELSITAWMADLVWLSWIYNPSDKNYLRETVHPFLRECCEFYQSILVRDAATGTYIIELSHSPEQFGRNAKGEFVIVTGRNPTVDLSCLRTLLDAFIESCESLGDNADGLLERCRDIRAHLPEFPTLDGILIDHAVSYYPQGDRTSPFAWCHRTPSRLVPIFPSRQIGLHSDTDALELGRRSWKEFGSYGDSDFSGWSYSWQAAIAARLGLGIDAEACLRRVCDAYTFKGLLTSHNKVLPEKDPIYQIDALLGFPAGLNEMLLQSAGGIIRLFPAIPEGRTARFTQLRAPGGILVSASWDGKQAGDICIVCENACDVRLLNPFDNAAPTLHCDGEPPTRLAGNVLQWFARPLVQYRLMQ